VDNEFTNLLKSVLRWAGRIAIVLPWLLLVNSLSAQNLFSVSSNEQSAWPRPYAFGGMALNRGNGYSPAGANGGVGFDIETPHALALTEFSADNGHKEDSGTGHDLYFQARAFYHATHNWYFGGGAQWNNLITNIYSKESWRPTFGGGTDLLHSDFSVRAQILYIMPGSDHLNAVQGPEISLWLPSPATRKHFFYRQTVGIYEFHQTSVPGNPGTNVREVAGVMNCTAMYRF